MTFSKFIDNLQLQSFEYFWSFEQKTHIWEFLFNYHTFILVSVLFLLGIIFGWKLKNSQLDICLSNFREFKEAEVKIRESKIRLQKRFGYLRNLLVFTILAILIYISVIIKRSPISSFFDVYFFQHKIAYLIIFVLGILFKTSTWLRNWKISKMETNLKLKMNKKHEYFTQFVQMIGQEMKEGILGSEAKLFDDKKNKEKAKIEELQQKIKNLNNNIANLQDYYRNTEFDLKVLSEFTDLLFQFDWCKTCYDETRIKEFVLNNSKYSQNALETKTELGVSKNRKGLENQINKENRVENTVTPDFSNSELCQKDCLIYYHIFCQHLNSQCSEKLLSRKNK